MAYYLAKTEPTTYSIDDFSREKQTLWDGVRNAQALQAIRAMRKGDRVFIYHSGGVSAIVGLAEVTGAPQPDPNDEKSVRVPMKYLRHLPATPLAEIKAAGQFADWALIRQSRLSTMAAPDAFVDWMRARYPKEKI
jgi:predicted RNA-binding protein with PUA-like domain